MFSKPTSVLFYQLSIYLQKGLFKNAIEKEVYFKSERSEFSLPAQCEIHFFIFTTSFRWQAFFTHAFWNSLYRSAPEAKLSENEARNFFSHRKDETMATSLSSFQVNAL